MHDPRGHRMRWESRLVFGGICGLVSLMAGCPPQAAGRAEIRPLREAKEAIFRINDNLSRIDRALNCQGIVSMRFRDTQNKEHVFFGNPTTILVDQPQCLRFDVRSIAGSIGRMGSNDDYYWMWVTAPDTRKMWWGTWAALREGRARRVAVNPRQLLDAWLMQPLPESLPNGTRPLLLVEGEVRRLLFPVLNKENWPSIQREVYIDPNPPYMPIRVVDRRPDGEIYMDARLDRFKPIEDAGPAAPLTARSYDVKWPLVGAVMTLSLDSVSYHQSDIPFCDLDPSDPESFDGERESLDEPARRIEPLVGLRN